MSLILDALRKMEQERKSRLGGSVDIRPEVLRYRSSSTPQPRERKPYLQIVVAVILLAGGVGAGVFFNRGSHSEPAREATVAAVVEPAAGSHAAPPAPLPEAVAPQPVAPVAAAPAPVVAQPPAAPKAPPAYPAPVAVERRAAKSAKSAQVEAPQQAAAVEDFRGASDITVSGIAWQEERSMRRAVVNGALVGEGAEVAGARIVDIRETRVRFSRGGHLFDVSYSGN
ncbi:hypothetical protein LPW11_16940 [Geomonas sp. RF6]|uniref:hypothetical protein n=1 Tax=Geomonas sp. RF6 TaxID=2897342 RepID=UPI001E49165A|nr:hypothetical protein [Geomonas sp. RF6]UFS69573.1 hypothetical protein LPW11_16940 [Geomonas sp. RF6]